MDSMGDEFQNLLSNFGSVGIEKNSGIRDDAMTNTEEYFDAAATAIDSNIPSTTKKTTAVVADTGTAPTVRRVKKLESGTLASESSDNRVNDVATTAATTGDTHKSTVRTKQLVPA